MSLSTLKQHGYTLPEKEPCDGLSAKDILDKIQRIKAKNDEANLEFSEFIPDDLTDLLIDYPKSMLDRNMSETLQWICTLMYEDGQPTPEEIAEYQKKLAERYDGRFLMKPEQFWSYEHLAVLFDKSKSVIHSAIIKHKVEAKRVVAEARLRKKAKDIALQELVAEEKKKIQNQSTDQKNEQTTEQTPNSMRGGI